MHEPAADATVRKIALLPDDVANQIAAGEVVERPASVVKELVENALDAGATVVTVSIDGGGLSRIAVTDDGVGMHADDLALAVVRHATSKIRSAADLVGVGTYGFRGEALPSIGSVARMRITSRARGQDEGAEVRTEGGGPTHVQPAGCATGTTVSVEDLFYNTPARRKFLRTPQTEWGSCADAVVRLAMPRPEVRFVLRRDGKPARELLRRDDVGARAREIWPDETLAEARGERGGLRVLALLGPPERARSGAAGLMLYVNGRHVRDRLLMRAIAQAYGSTLESGRYPVGALLLEVPAGDVDVNVHPQKSEVRFAAQNDLFATIVSLLRNELGRAPWARHVAGGAVGSLAAPAADFWTAHFAGGPVASPPPPPSTLFTDAFGTPPSATAPTPFASASPASASPASASPASASSASSASASSASASPASSPSTLGEPDPWGLAPASDRPPASYATAASATLDARPPTPTALRDADLLGVGTFGSLRYVAQLRRLFLLCEGETGMVVLDQHAAAERVTFDRLRRAYGTRAVTMQPLLVPEPVEVTAREVALAEERATELLRIGVELTVIGPTTLAVRAVPALLVRADPRRLARDVLAELARQGNDFSRAMDLVLATMACHGSVRAGDTLHDDEARALLRALDDVDFAGHCPHGRPVVWSVRWTELERRLGR